MSDGAMDELKDEVGRLSKESFDYRDAWMELSTKHEALLEAAKTIPGVYSDSYHKRLYDAIAACGGDDECDHKFIDSKCCLKCGWTP